MQDRTPHLDGRSPVFVPGSKEFPPFLFANMRYEQWLRKQQASNMHAYSHAYSTMAHSRSARQNPKYPPPTFSLPSRTALYRITHHMFHQGENNTGFVPSMPYEPLYNEGSSVAAHNSTDSDLSGALYPPDANGVPSGMFAPPLNQSLAHQPVRCDPLLVYHC